MADVRRLLVDVRPLRTSPHFRRLWAGQVLSSIGSQMTVFAVALQAYLITGSSLAVGGVGLASAVPGIVAGLLGGSVIDAVDRRRLVLVTSTLALAVSSALAVQAFAEAESLWLLYALVGVQGAVGAVGGPARQTFMPRLLPPDQVAAGAALGMLAMHTSTVTGPALAGVITAAGGLKVCYLIDALSFVGALYGVVRLPAMRPEDGGRPAGLRSTLEGLRFVRRTRVVAGALLADVNATVLAMPFALFPAVAHDRFGGSPRLLGLMTTAVGVGGLAGAVLSGPLGRVTRPGRAMLALVAVWGLALAGFGIVDGAAATLVLLAVAGAADVGSVVLRQTIVALATPDGLRGRVNSVNYVVGALCPQLGNFRAGVVASLAGPGTAAVVGGLLCAAGAAGLARGVPSLTGYRTDTVSQAASRPAG
ncbi:MFS transporter [Jatrophihabitans fulvus]